MNKLVQACLYLVLWRKASPIVGTSENEPVLELIRDSTSGSDKWLADLNL